MSEPGDMSQRCESGPLSLHLKQAQQAIQARKTEVVQTLHPAMTVQQAQVLSQLLDYGPQSTAQLARAGGVAPQSMAGVVSGVVARGWARKSVSPDHARVLLLSLTPEGRDLATAAQAKADDVEERVRTGLSAAEEGTLIDLLARVTALAGPFADPPVDGTIGAQRP
ncbi:MarR family winged helix-turn-helix transcriptional regulator [Streptomyces sp. NPDC057199]|uniref:MarR family winged helix-turn-helix transcriptional regulator n=1 Tax=Streptomyces sp. NPDC057199 TaxID=3346047 RepID=UPI003627AD21